MVCRPVGCRCPPPERLRFVGYFVRAALQGGSTRCGIHTTIVSPHHTMPFPSEHKVGAFRDWKEDDELCEIFLPVPAGTLKADLVVVVTSETIRVRHVKLQKTLLCADPLAGPVQADESTWYLQEELLTIVLAKQWRGSTKSDQYWGDSMVPKLASAANAAPKQKDYLGLDEPTSVTTAKPVTFECYMTVAQVARARKEREQKEAEQEKERHARVKASQRKERAARESQSAASSKMRRRGAANARAADYSGDDDDELDFESHRTGRRALPPNDSRSSWLEMLGRLDWNAVALVCILLLLLELGLEYWAANHRQHVDGPGGDAVDDAW